MSSGYSFPVPRGRLESPEKASRWGSRPIKGNTSPVDDIDSSNDFAPSPDSDANYSPKNLSSGVNIDEDEDSDDDDVFAKVMAPKRRAITRMRGSATKPKASVTVRKVNAIKSNNLGYINEISRSSVSDPDLSNSSSYTSPEHSKLFINNDTQDLADLSDTEKPLQKDYQNENRSIDTRRVGSTNNGRERFTGALSLGFDRKIDMNNISRNIENNVDQATHFYNSKNTSIKKANSSEFLNHSTDEVTVEDLRTLYNKCLVTDHGADKM